MLITSMTGNLNLKSCARVKYNPIYADPILFCIILYFDHTRYFPSEIIAWAYVVLVLERIVVYYLFMRNLIVQLCDYLEIPFIGVKQGYKKD
jgi:hypothetical protein